MDTDLEQLVNLSKGFKLLYVEDNEKTRESTVLLLENFFDDITVACDGMDGLNKYNEFYEQNNKYYDLIISDINMPKMNGIEMSEAIFSLNKDQYIIVVTAFNDMVTMKQLIDIGISNYLHKPLKIDDLIITLNKAITSYKKQLDYNQQIETIKELNKELDAMVVNFNTYVIASRTNLKGEITYASKAYETISGYTHDELLGQPHNIVRHPEMPKEAFADMWNTIQDERLWIGEVKNLRKDGTSYWVEASVAPYYDINRNHIGYSSIRVDITNQKKVEELNDRINNLLHNAEQGFLSFDKSLKCGYSCSHECLNIFDLETIHNIDISELLFESNSKNKQLFINGISNILDTDDTLVQDLMLSLLPKEQIVNDKIITLKYKILDDDKFMMILTDISEKKGLEKYINYQNKVQRMIVAVASNKEDFIELKNSYENFIVHTALNTKSLLRELHTFKGVFLQKEMVHTAIYINELETKINNAVENNNADFSEVIDIFNKADLEFTFSKDISIINNALGKSFLEVNVLKSVDISVVNNIYSSINQILHSSNIDCKEKLRNILPDFDKLTYEPLYNMLTPYVISVKEIALKLNKEICPLEIVGDKSIMVPNRFHKFVHSLIHVFNNSIDHGIENIDIRFENNKDEFGTIKCNFSQFSSFGLSGQDIEMIKLEISDDGCGIDTSKLVKIVLDKNKLTLEEASSLDENEKLQLVFMDNITIKDEQNIVSGRGVGMAAVKEEVDKLGGKIDIKNTLGKGVTFTFILPKVKNELSDNLEVTQVDEEIILNSIIHQTNIFLNANSTLKIINEQSIDDFKIFDIVSAIKFENDYSGIVIYSFEKDVIKNIVSEFIPKDSNMDDMIAMVKELPGEIANITIGLALSDFPQHIRGVDILPPLNITTSQINEYISNSDINYIKEISTSKGKIVCAVIKLGEVKC